MTDRIIV